MPTLPSTLRRLTLNQSARSPVLEDLSGEKLTLWQGLAARIEVALFSDTPSADTLVDISNIDSVDLIVRKQNANGAILFTQEVTSLTETSYAVWLAEEGQHLAFELTEIDTTQIVPASGRLQIYFVVTATTTDNVPYIAGFGYGEIVDAGYVENPVSLDYVTGRTPIVGGKLLTDLDLNGRRIIDSSGSAYTEEGSVVLTADQLEVEVEYEFEKLSADGYRFDYLYIKNENGIPSDVRPVLNAQTTLGFTVQLSAFAVAGTILYWKIVPKITVPTPVPSPRYAILPTGFPTVWLGLEALERAFVIVSKYGALGRGVIDETNLINLAIDEANETLTPLFFPWGVYRVRPGDLHVVYVSVYGSDAYLRGINGDLANLLTVNYNSSLHYTSGIANDHPTITCQIGFASYSTVLGGANYGLGILGAHHTEFHIHKAINLVRGVNLDMTVPASAGQSYTENRMRLKSDACGDMLYIKSDNNTALPPDANSFELETSFQPVNSIVRLDCGTLDGCTSNNFILPLIEIPVEGSNGVEATGFNEGNVFEFWQMRRGGNVAGKYFYLDAYCKHNLIINRARIQDPFNYDESTIVDPSNIVQSPRSYWVSGSFNASGTLLNGFNSAIVKLGTGDYRITFPVPVHHTNFMAIGTCGHNQTSQRTFHHAFAIEPNTRTSCRVQITSADGVLADSNFVAFRIDPL